MPEVLQFPNTASSGLKLTCLNSGFSYFLFSFVDSSVCINVFSLNVES